MYEIIKRPLITEKNSMLNAQNTYVFEVAMDASKDIVRTAIEKAFQVKVANVRTMVCRGRAKVVGRNIAPKKYWKKALVRLADGEKIKMFEGA